MVGRMNQQSYNVKGILSSNAEDGCGRVLLEIREEVDWEMSMYLVWKALFG